MKSELSSVGFFTFDQLPYDGPLFQHISCILCRVAQNSRSRSHIVHDPGACANGSTGMYGGVVFYGGTPPYYNTIAQCHRTCKAAMPGHDTRSADNTIVRYLYQVVDFTTITNDSGIEFSPINT